MQKINTSDGLFKNYNKINLTAGTVITAEWLNAVQQELTNAIEAFGVSLDSTRSDQLKDIIIGILDGKLDINNVSAIFPNMTGQSGKFLATDGINRFWAAPSVSHLDLINKGDNTHAQIDQHIANRSNPHNITKEQLDLENVINVKQQPESLTLTALSLTAAEEDKVPYYDGINSAKTTTLTSFARTILDDVSAEEVRATLGLGSSATKASTEFEPSGSIQAHVQAYNHEGMLPANQVAAAAGTYGTPSDINRYVTDDDPRLEEIGNVKEHAFTHATTGTDAITPEMIGAEQSGTAQSTINTHESTYNHTLIHSNTNDPSSDEKAALAGTSGTPSTTNKYVTNSDSRLSDARTPLSHNHNTLYEPINANLTAISGLSPAADKLPYFTGEATAALATFTTFARALLDDADAATACSTLGLGTIATQATNNVSLTGGSISGMTSISGSTLASTVATGTAPISVTSTTLVTNLNTDTVDGFHASQTPAANQIPVLNSSARLVLDGIDDNSSKIQTGGIIKAGGLKLSSGNTVSWGDGTISISDGNGFVVNKSSSSSSNAIGTKTISDKSEMTVYSFASGASGDWSGKSGIYLATSKEDSSFNIWQGSSNRFKVVSATGEVLVNTTSLLDATAKLQVNGTIYATDANIPTISKKVFTTTSTGSEYVNQYTKVGRITLNVQYEDVSGKLSYGTFGQNNTYQACGELSYRVKQALAFGNNPAVEFYALYDAGTMPSVNFYYVIIQNTPKTIVDIYVKNSILYSTVQAYILHNKPTASLEWFSLQAYVSEVSNIIEIPAYKKALFETNGDFIVSSLTATGLKLSDSSFILWGDGQSKISGSSSAGVLTEYANTFRHNRELSIGYNYWFTINIASAGQIGHLWYGKINQSDTTKFIGTHPTVPAVRFYANSSNDFFWGHAPNNGVDGELTFTYRMSFQADNGVLLLGSTLPIWDGTSNLQVNGTIKSTDININSAASISANSIGPTTNDAADNSFYMIRGGGSGAPTRGSYVACYGNEHSTNPGNLTILSGIGDINIYTGSSGSLRSKILSTGEILIAQSNSIGTDYKLQVGGPICAQGLKLDGTVSSDVNTLDYYKEGTFTVTGTGFSGTAPTGTATYVRVGKQVTIILPTLNGTSNATTFTLTGAPSEIVPQSNVNSSQIRIIDNGSVLTWGCVFPKSDGTFDIRKDPNGSAFTASGTKGIGGGTFVYYLI